MKDHDAARHVAPDAPPPEAGTAGWAELGALTGGLDPEQVPALTQARALQAFYPLLHALVGRSLRDFLVRVAALESLVEAGRSWFSSAELAESLYWLDAAARDATFSALRREGWLEHEPAAGTRVTDAGRWAHEVLSLLRRSRREGDLLPTVAGLSYSRDGYRPDRAAARRDACSPRFELAQAISAVPPTLPAEHRKSIATVFRALADALGVRVDVSSWAKWQDPRAGPGGPRRRLSTSRCRRGVSWRAPGGPRARLGVTRHRLVDLACWTPDIERRQEQEVLGMTR